LAGEKKIEFIARKGAKAQRQEENPNQGTLDKPVSEAQTHALCQRKR